MSNRKTGLALKDRLRGMLLLSAYGDALGADHEAQQEIHSAPLPDRLPEQTLMADSDPWQYWATENQLNPPVKGLITDDTAFKLFLLHPWLQEVLDGGAGFDETSFRQFLTQLKTSETQPTWIRTPRDGQIESWLDMYRAAVITEASEFFRPEVPIVFGLFMFLELAAFRTDYSPAENYLFFRDFTVLDQGYAKSATGFFIAITSSAFASDPVDRFDDWLLRQSQALAGDLPGLGVDSDEEVSTILRLVESMTEFGKGMQGRTPHEFMVAFEAAVVDPTHPPFMNASFEGAVFDPLRMLAEMYAATAYAAGDPARAIQPLAFGSGDSDTVCSMLGILLGIWFGENALRQHADLNADLTVVERLLRETFQVNLNQHVALFMQLRGERESPPTA